MATQEDISSYRTFIGKLTSRELKYLNDKIEIEKNWVTITPNDPFFTSLRRNGVSIKSETDMSVFRNMAYKNLRANSPDLQPRQQIISRDENVSLDELDWIPGEPVAFYYKPHDSDIHEPFFISFPEEILPGRVYDNGSGLPLHFMSNDQNNPDFNPWESEFWVVRTSLPLIGLGKGHLGQGRLGMGDYGVYSASFIVNWGSISVEQAYAGKDAIFEKIKNSPDIRRYFTPISQGKFPVRKIMKRSNKKGLKKILEELKF